MSVRKKALLPLEGLYHVGDRINRLIKKSKKLNDSYVVSIGNLTVGGTGKTPAAIYFSRLLQHEYDTIAILSRGYGGSKSKEGAILTDGKNLYLVPDECGDEPYLLAKNLDSVPIAIGKNRYQMGLALQEKYNPDLFILDDGFQHYALHRDVDIVLIDATNPFGNEHLLPNGILREPLDSLKRADIIIITKADLIVQRELDVLTTRLQEVSGHEQIFHSIHKAASLVKLPYDYFSTDSKRIQQGFNVFQKENIWALSAIGNHRAFEKQLLHLGAASVNSITFRDHYNYTEKDVASILKRISSYDIIVTTEKDWIKLSPFHSMFANLKNFYFLEIDFTILNNEVLLKEGIKAKLLLGKS